MRRLLPLLLAAVLAPSAHAAPAVLPGCTMPALPPDPGAVDGNGYLRVTPGGTASWVVNGARWGSWHGDRVAYWTEPFTVDTPSLLCVDGAPVAVGKRAQHEERGRVAWSPDGTRLAYFAGDVLTVRAGDAVTSYGVADSFDWAPDGSALLARGYGSATVHRLDGTSTGLGLGSATALWRGDRVFFPGDSVYDPVGDTFLAEYVSVLPDGTDRRVHGYGHATPSEDGTRVVFWDDAGLRVVGVDGTDLGSLAIWRPMDLTWAPGNALLAFSSRAAVYTWDGTSVVRRSSPRLAYYPAWSATALTWVEGDGTGTQTLVHDGTAVATGAYAYDLDLVRREADGSFLVEAERLPGLGTVG